MLPVPHGDHGSSWTEPARDGREQERTSAAAVIWSLCQTLRLLRREKKTQRSVLQAHRLDDWSTWDTKRRDSGIEPKASPRLTLL